MNKFIKFISLLMKLSWTANVFCFPHNLKKIELLLINANMCGKNEMFDNYTLKIQTPFVIMKLYRLMKSGEKDPD